MMRPTGKEYTRRHVGGRAANGELHLTHTRIDKFFFTPEWTSQTNTPHVVNYKHIRPMAEELLALKTTGSQAKWSDHAAVQITLRLTQTPKARARWGVLPAGTVAYNSAPVAR